MKALLSLIVVGALVSSIAPSPSYAVSDACKLWLCLPAGFPVSECNGAKKAMLKRLKKGKSPLPSYGSCFGNSSGNGNVKFGFDKWEECKAGYEFIDYIDPFKAEYARACFASTCVDKRVDDFGKYKCDDAYRAKPPEKPYWMEVWVNGEYYGKSYYSYD